MTDIVERLRDAYEVAATRLAAAISINRRLTAEVQRLTAEIERLRAALGKLKWKSIDKDNMEFRCDTTCYVMDEIRAALAGKHTA